MSVVFPTGLAQKTNPVAADQLLIADSQALDASKRTTVAQLLAGANVVVGPGSTSAGRIATYQNSTGTALADSGASIPAGGIADAAFVNLPSSSGLLTGGLLSINADPSKFDISDGSGYVIDNYTTPGSPTSVKVTWTGKTGISDAYVTTDTATTVLIDSTGAVVQKNTPPTDSDYRDYVVIGKTIHPSKTVILGVAPFAHSLPSSDLFSCDLSSFIGVLAQGVEISANGANLNLDRSSGSMLRTGCNLATSRKTPNVATLNSATAISFQYRYRNGSGGFKTNPSTTSVTPSVYDDGSGTLQDPGVNKYTLQRVYVFTNGNTFVVPGQAVYNSLSEAVAAIRTETPTVDPQLADASLRCFLAVKRGTAALNSSSDAYFQSGGLLGTSNASAVGSTNVTFVAPRVTSLASSATPTVNVDTTDMYCLTALATAPTFQAPTGTPVDGQSLTFRIKDDGTPRVLNWDAMFRGTLLASDLATTVAGKTHYGKFLYNAAASKYDCVAVRQVD